MMDTKVDLQKSDRLFSPGTECTDDQYEFECKSVRREIDYLKIVFRNLIDQRFEELISKVKELETSGRRSEFCDNVTSLIKNISEELVQNMRYESNRSRWLRPYHHPDLYAEKLKKIVVAFRVPPPQGKHVKRRGIGGQIVESIVTSFYIRSIYVDDGYDVDYSGYSDNANLTIRKILLPEILECTMDYIQAVFVEAMPVPPTRNNGGGKEAEITQMQTLEDIAKEYSEGQKICSIISKNATQTSSSQYRIAVIGEFKRGKSSLINALVGASILPTDIVPVTAVITRVVYGDEQKIKVLFKDGTREEKSLSDLVDYAAQYGTENEKTGGSIDEIIVEYPSEICRNNIELIDTPGLNDCDAMSDLAMDALKNVDAAIVVLTASSPLSLSEQLAVCNLLGQESLRNIIFVVTCIDELRDEESRDRVLELIRKRITENLLNYVEETLLDKPLLVNKARSLFQHPVVFGVSSSQALKGIADNDEMLLKQSRFPAFKEELAAIITAARSEDQPRQVRILASMMSKKLPSWKESEEKRITDEMEALKQKKKKRTYFLEHSEKELISWFRSMDNAMENKGLSPYDGFVGETQWTFLLRKCFIRSLSELNRQRFTKDILLSALEEGRKNAEEIMRIMESSIGQSALQAMQEIHVKYGKLREAAGLPGDISTQIPEGPIHRPIPRLQWAHDPIAALGDMEPFQPDVMPIIRDSIQKTVENYGKEWNQCIGAWRLSLIQRNRKDMDIIRNMDSIDAKLSELSTQKEVLNRKYEQHLKMIQIILTANQ